MVFLDFDQEKKAPRQPATTVRDLHRAVNDVIMRHNHESFGYNILPARAVF